VAFDQKGKTIYFTGTDRNSENKEGRPTLHIYRSHKIDGHWGAVEDLSINGSTFSNAHPALSPDGKTLYFVSDREGSLGQTDIFYCSIGDDGTLGLPKNIGKEVNTIGRESFPFVSEDGILFFASDGRLGQGGLDIFLYPLNEGSGAYNLGKSINGPFDDYAIFMQKGSKHGFFSSNRTGNDNIYRLTQLLPFEALTHMTQTLRLTDSSNGMPIFGASVRVFDSEGKLLAHTITDQEGHFELNLPRGQKFDITIEKEGYNDSNWSFDRPVYISDLKMALEPKPNFKFKNVYFAFNSASLVEKAKADLDTIAHTLKTSPKVHLHIHSYTDSRGSKAYNLKLSEQRMRAVRDYLKEKGIMESRLFGQAHGEEDLIIPCTDGIPCTEEQHSKNRRTEFIVSKDL
jgi:outer membrane protein OmpA-like peptidoglycan-associated protein